MNDAPTLAGRIRRDLWHIVDYYDATLEPSSQPSSQSSGGSRVAASKEPPLPISAHILDTRRDARTDLINWAGFILDEIRDINGHPLTSRFVKATPDHLVPFISTWVDHVIEQFPEDADMWAAKAEKHARDLYAIVFPPRREWLAIGDCPVTVARDGQSELCGSRVRAYPDRQFIQCPGCGTEDTLAWWMSQIVPEGSDRATATEVIAYVAMWSGLIVHHEQIRKWASLGHIRRHGRDVKGRTLYSSAAVLAYAKDQTKEEAA